MIDITVVEEGLPEFRRITFWMDAKPYGHMICVECMAKKFEEKFNDEKQAIEQLMKENAEMKVEINRLLGQLNT